MTILIAGNLYKTNKSFSIYNKTEPYYSNQYYIECSEVFMLLKYYRDFDEEDNIKILYKKKVYETIFHIQDDISYYFKQV